MMKLVSVEVTILAPNIICLASVTLPYLYFYRSGLDGPMQCLQQAEVQFVLLFLEASPHPLEDSIDSNVRTPLKHG